MSTPNTHNTDAAAAKPTTVMIAYDGSDNAKRAIRYAGKFLTSPDKVVHALVVTAWESSVRQASRVAVFSGALGAAIAPDDYTTLRDPMHAAAQVANVEGLKLARSVGFRVEGELIEVTRTVWDALVSEADRNDVDMIVTGTRGETGLKALIHSSVAEHVFKQCKRPVMIVPACAAPLS